ncbi:MAG: ABC transporter substrate-binding protein [Actinomycetaceae bacterium]|nr:ABC transporter substrate-binding protein [Arcanobacterium sp.]MDD7687621.1 ABC transporter substrate-binding protein [Actinomycetaceae bacterium]MDY5273140.1 ABC transporter substrate-binding protein [Arcanobacterium sp.]
MKKITAIGSFLVGALLVLLLVMPSLQRLNELEHAGAATGNKPAAEQATGGASGQASGNDLVPASYQPVGAERIVASGKAKQLDPKNPLLKHGDVLKVGILQFMEHPSLDDIRYGLLDELAKRGYINGVNMQIEYQQGQGDQNLLKTIADNFMADGKDLLIGIATPAAQALMNSAQGDVPVVFAGVSDPVGAGLVADLKKPGKLVSGATYANNNADTLKLIKEIQPDAKRLGVLYNTSEQNAVQQVQSIRQLAPSEGFTLKEATITSTNDLKQVAEQLATEVDAIYLPQDNTIASSLDTLVPTTTAHKVGLYPTVDAMVQSGCLATVGLNQYLWGADSGDVAADVIEGADLATYPVKVSTISNKFINSTQAAALGMTIPPAVSKDAIDMNPAKK